MRIECQSVTHPGRRRLSNEDCVLACEHQRLFVVADGMGGHQGGEIASALVISHFEEVSCPAGWSGLYFLEAAFRDINEKILMQAHRDPALRGMGSTATALLFDDLYYNLMQVGDSRAYRFRNGKIEQMTRDDTWIQQQIESGDLTPREAAHHCYRNQLTRALGRENTRFEPGRGLRREGDVWLLCSDGLTGVVPDVELEYWLARHDLSAQELCCKLIDLANAAGGPDNISVILVRDGLPGERNPPEEIDLFDSREATEPDGQFSLRGRAARSLSPLVRDLYRAIPGRDRFFTAQGTAALPVSRHDRHGPP